MKTILISISFFLLGGAFRVSLHADSLTLRPNSTTIDISSIGQPIDSIFTLTGSDYAIFSNSALEQSTQGYSTYTDSIGSQFLILRPAPNPQSSVSADLELGRYIFNPGAPSGVQLTGVSLDLFYTLYSVDPNSRTFDPIADYVSSDEVSVSNITLVNKQPNAGPPLQAPPSVPEPSSWALAMGGLLLVSGSLLRKPK